MLQLGFLKVNISYFCLKNGKKEEDYNYNYMPFFFFKVAISVKQKPHKQILSKIFFSEI